MKWQLKIKRTTKWILYIFVINSPYLDRPRSPIISLGSDPERLKLSVSVIQETLGNSINNLLKFFERPDADKYLLTPLLCGENGLAAALEHVFLYGFKSYKLFSKKLFIWDFLEKVAYEFEGSSMTKLLYSPPPSTVKAVKSTDRFTNTIREINLKSANFGKDGKFQIFVCLACR